VSRDENYAVHRMKVSSLITKYKWLGTYCLLRRNAVSAYLTYVFNSSLVRVHLVKKRDRTSQG